MLPPKRVEIESCMRVRSWICKYWKRSG